jgi:hypothetical protein
MPPPIRHSVAKKELLSRTLANGYTAVPTLAGSAKPGPSRMPQVDGVKYSQDKIRFATDTPGGTTTTATTNSSATIFKTPATRLKKGKMAVPMKDSPLYPNPKDIKLPEIPSEYVSPKTLPIASTNFITSSEDEAEKPSFNVPQWAESPELREILAHQEGINALEVFGPISKIDMEAVFNKTTDDKKNRFRARTSSANWSAADRLNDAEIQADQAARRLMMETGKWTFPTGF